MRRFLGAATFVMLVVSASASADEVREIDVKFPAGATGTTMNDSIVGYDSVLYSVGAEAGQVMSVEMSASNLATYFNIYEPGRGPGDEALVVGQFTDPINAWSGVLSLSGEYTISVYMMRSAARRNEQSNFMMNISVAGETGAIVQGDYADGLAGGPDFLAVAVSGGGSLNLRSAPSAGAATVTRLANGQNVRNLGCRMAEGRRWCNVATLADPGEVGWAAGDFLIEGTGAAVQLPVTVPSSGAGGERVSFAPGTSGAELIGSLAPGESLRYLIGANNGQDLYVRVAPQGQPISYQIFNPDGSFLLDQITSDQEYRGQLWQSGDHAIEVINRTNATANYNVIIGID